MPPERAQQGPFSGIGHQTTKAQQEGARIHLTWLIRPRWVAAGAFLLTLAASQCGLVQPMPALPMLLGAAITALSNLALGRLHRCTEPLHGLAVWLLLADAALLTGVLFFSGGAANPLTALYLMPIALGAVLLPARGAWLLAAVAVTAFFLLFFSPQSDSLLHRPPQDSPHDAHVTRAYGVFDLHLQGMWVAFTLTALSTAYFVTQIATALRAREAELVDVRARAFRAERVAALASLAASTAHELGTPLASIQLAASEMSLALSKGGPTEGLASDVDLVRAQVRRCREILDAMLNEAGEIVGELPSEQEAHALVADAIAGLPAIEQSRIAFPAATTAFPMRTPRRIVTQAIQNLLRNALDASPQEQAIRVEVTHSDTHVTFHIYDQGIGMDRETLERALEPFVTSKPGRGKGLGLFLTHSVADRLGGALRLQSTPGEGTHAALTVLADAMATGRGSTAPNPPPLPSNTEL